MKNGVWGIVIVLLTLLVVGAARTYDEARHSLLVMDCTREYFSYDGKFPNKTEKVTHCFKIDKETGEVWIFKDERREVPNSNKILVKQYFEPIPYEETVLPRETR
jgi:hypothetical protein